MAETITLSITDLESLVKGTAELIQSVTFDECGSMVAGKWVGGNGGMSSRETLKVADRLRPRLEQIAALISDHVSKEDQNGTRS